MSGRPGGYTKAQNLNMTIERETKSLADNPLYEYDNYVGTNSDDFISKMANENRELRIKTNELMQNLEQLRHKMTEMKVQPIRLESSPDQAAKILRLESDKQRLMIQLSEKSQLVEELKLRVQDQPEGSQVRSRVEAIRREVEAELKIQYDIKQDELRNALDLLRKDLDEAKLKITHKEKEVEMMGDTISSLEMSALEEHEKLRTTLLQTLWDEFEKKLIARKNEFDEKCQNYLSEQERLTQIIKEWRRKCVELEDKNAQLYSQINSSSDDDMSLKRTITNYENELYNLRISLERANQVNQDINDKNSLLQEKINNLDSDISRYHEKEASLEDSLMEHDSKVRALTKELERSRLDCNTWKEQLGKFEKDNSKLRLSIHELQNQLKTNDRFKNSNSKELLWERTNTERLGIEVQSIETELRTALATRDAYKDQLEKTREEVLIKNSLIEDFKKYNIKLQGAQDQMRDELNRLKADLIRESDTSDLLKVQLTNLVQERDDMAYKIEADKLRSSRPERSALSILNRPRDATDIENKLLKEKLQEKETEVQAVKAKLGKFYNEIQPIAMELERDNAALKDENQNLQREVESLKLQRVHLIAETNQNPFAVFDGNPSLPEGFAESILMNQGRPITQNPYQSFGQFPQQPPQQNSDRGGSLFGGPNLDQDPKLMLEELMTLRQIKAKYNQLLASQHLQVDGSGQSQHESHDGQIQSMRNQLMKAKDEYDDLEARFSMLKKVEPAEIKKTEDFRMRVQSLEKERERLSNDLTQEKIMNQSLASEKARLESDIRAQRSSNDLGSKHELENRRLMSQIDHYRERENELLHIRQVLEADIVNLKDRLATSNKQLGEQRQATQTVSRHPHLSSNDAHHSQPQQPSNIDDQSQALDVDKMRDEIDRLVVLNDEMTKELMTRDNIITTLNDNLAKDHAGLGAENARIVNDLEYMNAFIDKIKDENLLLERDCNHLFEENKTLREDNTYLASIVSRNEGQTKQPLQLRGAQVQHEGQPAREADLNNHILSLETENTELYRKLESLERNVN